MFTQNVLRDINPNLSYALFFLYHIKHDILVIVGYQRISKIKHRRNSTLCESQFLRKDFWSVWRPLSLCLFAICNELILIRKIYCKYKFAFMCVRVCIHTCIHSNFHAYAHIVVFSYKCPYLCILVHEYIHQCIVCMHSCICVHAHVHGCVHLWALAFVHACFRQYFIHKCASDDTFCASVHLCVVC